MTVYYGFGASGKMLEILAVGNRVRIVGTVSEYLGNYQVSGLDYKTMRPKDPNNIQKLGDGFEGAYTKVTAEDFANKKVSITSETEEGTTITECPFAQLAMNSSISMDNLKVVNKTSYNSDTPTPDSIIKDKLELNGWEIYDPVKTLDVNTEVKELYPNQFKSYTINDVKTRFFNELLLNSKNIFTQKGTKSGIETLMSLFGFCSYDYAKNLYPYLSKNEQVYGKPKWDDLNYKEKQTYYDYVIDEYVAVATNKNSDILPMEDDFPCEIYNQMTSNFILRDEYNMDVDTLEGLPVREVDIVLTDGTEKKYLIPWFDKALYKNKKMYFQMYGGWNKISLKLIDEKIRVNNSITKHYNELRSSFESIISNNINRETKNYVRLVLLRYSIIFDMPYATKLLKDVYLPRKTTETLNVAYYQAMFEFYIANGSHTKAKGILDAMAQYKIPKNIFNRYSLLYSVYIENEIYEKELIAFNPVSKDFLERIVSQFGLALYSKTIQNKEKFELYKKHINKACQNNPYFRQLTK
jgi:hypothetical protein